MAAPPLHILQTCFSRSWGGLEIQALQVSQQLQRRGHRVWLASPPDSRLEREARRNGLTTLACDVRGYLHPVIVLRLAGVLRNHSIDIIHCQLSKDIATVVPAMRLARRHPPLLLSKRVGSYVKKTDPFHRFTYAHVTRVLAISDVIHRNVLDTTPMSPDRVLTLHDAIDTGLFSPDRIDRMATRKQFGFAEDDVVIGFVGRFSPGKGHEDLLNAAASLRDDGFTFRVLVIGEASYGEERYEDSIREMCRSLGLGAIVIFAGFRSDIPHVMGSFDILAFPSHAESFGLVLIEAMAMELPVVSTNCDGVLDIVVDGETGLYVHPRNPTELAAALKRLIRDPLLRTKMGKAGRQRVLQLFDQEKQIDTLENLYSVLLKHPGSLSFG